MRKLAPHCPQLSGDTQSAWQQQNARGIGYVVVTSSQTRSVHHPRHWQSAGICLLKDLTTSESHHWLHQTQQTKSLWTQEHSHHEILLRISASFVASVEVLSASKHHLPHRGMSLSVFFLGILPRTLPGMSSSSSSDFTPNRHEQFSPPKKTSCTYSTQLIVIREGPGVHC